MKRAIGHNLQIERLKKAVEGGRLPSAYLFHGPRGIGKMLIATEFAKALTCAAARGIDACGTCVSCRKIDGRNHPDVFFIAPDGEQIKIDQIRELKESVQFHPLEADLKIIIIDDADRMNESAENCLLKILEEPPDATHFMLVSSSPHSLLPTIRSRCQKLPFFPLSDEEVMGLLGSKGIPRETALRMARFAGGSVGAALSMDFALLGDVVERLMAISSRSSSADIISISDSWSKEPPEKIRFILEVMASWYADIIKASSSGTLQGTVHPEAAKLASSTPTHLAERSFREILRVKKGMDININKQLMFEHLLFTLTAG
jgi:DNA polymerase-3 subunit delta'